MRTHWAAQWSIPEEPVVTEGSRWGSIQYLPKQQWSHHFEFILIWGTTSFVPVYWGRTEEGKKEGIGRNDKKGRQKTDLWKEGRYRRNCVRKVVKKSLQKQCILQEHQEPAAQLLFAIWVLFLPSPPKGMAHAGAGRDLRKPSKSPLYLNKDQLHLCLYHSWQMFI